MVTLFMMSLITKVFATSLRVQYNAALAITDAIKGTSLLKIYYELGFESVVL